MPGLGLPLWASLVFVTPWILAALAVLPVIYWLLRATPPAPRRITFPAIRLLLDLRTREETPDRTPWWLLVLRLVVAGLIITALAGPVLNPGDDLPGQGPVLVVVDNGWAAADGWDERQAALSTLIDRAARQDRQLAILPTAPAADGSPAVTPQAIRASDAADIADSLTPMPWPVDRSAAAEALGGFGTDGNGNGHTIWLSDGLDTSGTDSLIETMTALGSVEAALPAPSATARLMAPPEIDTRQLSVPVHRAAAEEPETLSIRLIAADGRLLDRRTATFSEDATTATAIFDLPSDLRNEAVRVEIEEAFTAGAVALLDERWRRRPVGLVGDSADSAAQPLLDEYHYLTNALAPFSDVRTGSVDSLIDGGIAVIMLPDSATLSQADRQAIDGFIADGGVVVRFAGPRLAVAEDPLVPVPLRSGDRTLSGAMTWSEPMALEPFDDSSPFAGLDAPDDVRIDRQVLAQPTGDLSSRTWARLHDGTPLITADRRGDGWIVLMHTTATPEWSDLPLAGIFVEMLQRLVGLSEGVPSAADANATTTLNPLQSLAANGQLGPAPPTALPIPISALSNPEIGPRHPPGFYGTAESRRAISLGAGVAPPVPLSLPSGTVTASGYDTAAEINLMPWLMTIALALIIIDALIALVLRGLGPISRSRSQYTDPPPSSSGRRTPSSAGTAAVLLLAVGSLLASLSATGPGNRAEASQSVDDRVLKAATDTYLAYVETGVPSVDEVSRAGLQALTAVLRGRTSVEAEGAMGVDPATDDLTFFPLLYWPISPDHPDLSRQAVDRLNDYLAHGGMIVFDTRDQGLSTGSFGGTPAGRRLQSLTAELNIPALEMVPDDHVLTRAFYLLQDFPGRYSGGDVWVETPAERVNDGVSGVVIGGNDWASAWARDESGRSLLPIAGGGERQREMAYRFGVNLVIYALTGNYKADQVHVPAILERLTQ